MVYLGQYPLQNFDTGEDVTVPEGANELQIRKAIADSGALTKKQKFFGAAVAREPAPEQNPTAPNTPQKAPSEQSPSASTTVGKADTPGRQGKPAEAAPKIAATAPATSTPSSSPELQAYMAASAEVLRLETELIGLRSDTRIKPSGREDWWRKIGALERELQSAKALREQTGATLRSAPAPPAPKEAEQTGYSLPDDVGKDWTKYKSATFTPTPRQQIIMDAVQRALDAGAFYSDDILQRVARDLKVSAEVRASNRSAVQGGDLGYDAYYARGALDARKEHAAEAKAREEMALKAGDELGTLVFNDGKVTTSVTVTGTDDAGRYELTGKRGPATVKVQAPAISIKFAIERAHERGKRKTSYAEFLSERTTAPTAGAAPAPAATAAPATHQDPGQAPEPATPAVIAESLKTAAREEDRKPSAMKAELLARIDEAITEAPDYTEYQGIVKSMGLKDANAMFTKDGGFGDKAAPAGYSRPKRTFDVEGDGVFTVNNTVRQLLTFREKVDRSPGFRDAKTPPPATPRATDTLDRRGTDAAIANMIDERDFEAAKDFAAYNGVDVDEVKLTKVLRDRWDKWKKTGESAAKIAAWEAEQAAKKEAAPAAADRVRQMDKVDADMRMEAQWQKLMSGQPVDLTREEAAAHLERLNAAPGDNPKARKVLEAAVQPEKAIAGQTFDDWVQAEYEGNEYRAKYLEEFAGDEKRAMLGAVLGIIDNDRKSSELLKDARSKYLGTLLGLPREASIDLKVWDALDNMGKVEAQRHFYDLDGRISKRTQEETRARVQAEKEKKAPYEAAFAEVDAEIRRLDKLPGPETQKQKELSARRDRLREALFQIGQGKEPDGRLLRAEPALDMKGFLRTPRGNGAFDLTDGKLRVEVNPTDMGKFQARIGSAKSSPHLQGEQAAVDWAAQYREDAAAKSVAQPKPTAAPAPAAMKGPRRDPTTVNTLAAPYNDGDIVTIDGKDWMVRQDTPGWYLTSDGTWRGTHPTIKGIKAQADLIREVEQAAQAAAPAPAAKAAAAAPAPAEKPASKIEDFGQKLEGARKDYAATLKDAEAVDIAAEPLSKSWPEPDYDKLLAGGADPYVVAFVHAARDEVPTKPQKGWKLKGWVQSVETLRGASKKLLAGEISKDRVQTLLNDDAFGAVRRAVGSRAELYELVGHAKSLKGVTFAENHYTLYKGQNNVRKWVVEQKVKSTAFSNWPRELAVADTKAEMLEQFKAKFSAESLDGDKAKAATKGQFIIYRKRNQEGAFIGKKIGREYIDLKKLPDVAAARAYLESNTADLSAALERYKDTPFERNPENRPRVGDDHRNGAAVTPEVFADTFGFRGVQFGNYVEQDRRQSDLNQTFDALMDMAAVLGVPPRALSLNGRLGLAFGARGKGGKNAPAAHYEPDTVVINLTKGNGPGSLGHEWWHAVDNYFGKEFGAGGFATDGARVDRLRAEMQAAFKAVRNATQVPTLRKRAAELDKRRTKPYWNTPLELSARAFESYLIAKLNDQGAANDYLANVVDEKVWNLSEEARATFFGGEAVETYPYPGQAELPAVRAGFDEFFKVVEAREDDAGNVAMFSRAQFRRGDTIGRELRVTEIQKAVSRLTAGWLRQPDIHILDSMEDLEGDPDLDRMWQQWQRQNSQGASGNIEGFHYRGGVYLLADALVDEADVRRVLFHEALGHWGLRNVFGAQLNPILDQIATMRQALGKAKATQYGLAWTIEQARDMIRRERIAAMDAPDSPRLDLTGAEFEKAAQARLQMDRRDAAEEVLAEMAQTRPELGWVQRTISAIRRWLRAHGVSLGLSDNDIIADYILPARGWVERGKQAAASSVTSPPAFLRVFHGTPHQVDKFSTAKIGTGEGAQAYGWGLYFADSKEVADHYRRTLSPVAVDGTEVRSTSLFQPPRQNAGYAIGSRMAQDMSFEKAKDAARREAKAELAQLRQSESDLRARDKSDPGKDWGAFADQQADRAATTQRMVDAIEIMTPKDIKAGNIYEVEIPEDGEYLLWDKPLDEQPEKVRAALVAAEKDRLREILAQREDALARRDAEGQDTAALKRQVEILKEEIADENLSLGGSGERYYRALSMKEGSDKAASEALRAAGIRGIKYLDGASRNKSLRDVKREFLAELPEDAGFDEVMDLIGQSTFSPANEAILKELAANDWLGFDYPAQAISAALGGKLADFDASPALVKAVADAQEDGTFNYVIFDDADVEIARAMFSRQGDQTDTPAFRRWFGDSKVVDAEGKPLVVYHGTPAGDIDVFKVSKSGSFGGGIYTTPDAWAASIYANEPVPTGRQAAPTVYPVYVSIKNPAPVSEAVNVGNWRGEQAVRDTLMDRGYDGVIDWRSGEIVAFRPEQIKSAIGNRGTFDPGNPDIMFSRSTIAGATTRQYSPEQQRAMRNVGFEVDQPTYMERAQALWKDAGKKLAQGIADQFAPIKDLDAKAYSLLRLSKGASGAFETFLHGGKLKLSDGVYDFDEAARGGVLDSLLIPLQGEHHDFFRWVAANRAERLAREGRENLFTPQDIADLKTLADGQLAFDFTLTNGMRAGQTTRSRAEAYRDSLATFNAFNKNVLDLAEQSGLIDGESRHLWEHEFYVPFYRVAEDADGGIRGANIKTGVIRQEAFKKLKGGGQALNMDLLDNTLLNWAHLLDAAAKNRGAKATLEAAQRMGVAVEAPERVAREIGNATGNKQGVVWFMDEGLKRYFVVDDRYILEALTSLEYAGMRNPVMDAMGAFKHALTVGVTASPFFKVGNLIRDSVQVIGTSGIGVNPAANVAQGWKLTDPKSDAYFRLLAGGGTIHFGTMMEGNEAKRVQALVESGVDSATILNSQNKVKAFYRKYIEPGITAYNELGNRGEAVNRAALYQQLRAQGKDHAEASLQARDLMDFSMQGTFTTIRFLTQVVPFFNARIQGMYKLGRAAKEDPARFSAVLGATALFSIALLAAYGDDDDWKKREEWDRNNYWWFKFGDTAFRIPKPFEIGAVATLAERSWELAFDEEMTGTRFRKQVQTLLADNLSMNPIPQLIKPVVDVYANKDSFTGRPIETMDMERLRSDYRFTDRTSMFARGVSTAMNSVTGMIGAEALSPVQVDHMLRGYFGWLGAFIVGAGDTIARPATNQPTHPAPDYWKTVTGGMASDLRDAPSRYVSQMYEQAKEIEKAYGTWKMLLREGKIDEAREFREDNAELLNQHKQVERVKKAESALNQRARMIERSNMDPDRKRELLRQIQEQKDRTARLAS